MHLLAAKPGTIPAGDEAVDLGQTPGDIVVLSAAESEISCLAAAQTGLVAAAPDRPSLRLASLLRLRHNYSVDLYLEQVIAKARLVIVRLLGGESYWPYGVDGIGRLVEARGIPVAWLPGDDKSDPGLETLSTVAPDIARLLHRYLIEGGPANAANFLKFAAFQIGYGELPLSPEPLLRAGIYQPPASPLVMLRHTTDEARLAEPYPRAAILFYRALVQAGNLLPVDALVRALQARGIEAQPIFVQSLKDAQSGRLLEHLFAERRPDIVINATAFAVASPGAEHDETLLDHLGVPVIQAIFAGGTEREWRERSRGLDARDLAMNIVLPEVDGRIIGRAVSFKESVVRDPLTQADLTFYKPVTDRIDFVADLASGWVRLAKAPIPNRRVAVVLANYPSKDGRLGNGVGLDTPAGLIKVLHALRQAGYQTGNLPGAGQALMDRLAAGPTNADPSRAASLHLTLDAYRAGFAKLPRSLQQAVIDRWGEPSRDRFVDPDRGFRLPIIQLGNIAIGLQVSRGYDVDPATSYHAPDLVPPHAYIAFYLWLREGFGAHALVHMGKHGNAEWLPGKAVALSQECWPEAVMGPLPHLYPFIVNDPGEGTQAKRRAAAVIIDHLTPPLARAESYGPLARLEALIDEYMAAQGMDPRRLKSLGIEIRDLAAATGLDQDCGMAKSLDEDEALGRLDTHLCELKEMQIRDGLHVFGQSPEGEQRRSLLIALARAPRGAGAEQASLIRALAVDLGLGIDPLLAPLGEPYKGCQPPLLGATLPQTPWRSNGDTVERLELLAEALLDRRVSMPVAWQATPPVLAWIDAVLAPDVDRCGTAEIAGLLTGLDGRFVAPGPSGAPSRGRPEVLPTGRNFYSLDTRAVPTQAAWELGWRSACALIDRYAQDQGEYPQRMALSVWGTANMRTGGDDIAQALALMGVKPVWEPATGRVTGFEILPASVLGRPRVDVTIRVSGLFRDAFPNLIDLLDAAARAVAALDEAADINPLAAQVKTEAAALVKSGMAADRAFNQAATRIFGSKPGAYGAGLQALIDEGGWREEGDLAEAYLAWGQWAYGAGQEGRAEGGLLRQRLGRVQAVLHNQDNREHDLLDSDDYYQFEGGLAAAVTHVSGQRPALYHNDHSRPEQLRIRSLEEEIARIVRGRAVNPKWIAGVMRHGYKGAFEMAATVDYLFAFAATAKVVRDHHFDAVYEAYLADPAVLDFLDTHNPAARVEMAERLAEAIRRGLWQPRRNSIADRLSELAVSGANSDKNRS